MAADQFIARILDDGTLQTSTDRVSAANHQNAENFHKEMFRMAGGEVEIRHKHKKGMHVHSAPNMDALEASGGGEHGHEH